MFLHLVLFISTNAQLRVRYKHVVIYCPSCTTQWCKDWVMQQLTKLHVSTPWGHLQAYKIWYHTRYFYKPEDDPKVLKHVALLIVT